MICPNCNSTNIVLKKETNQFFCKKCKNYIVPIRDVQLQSELTDYIGVVNKEVRRTTIKIILDQVEWALTFAFGIIIYRMVTEYIIDPLSTIYGLIFGGLVGLLIILLIIVLFLYIRTHYEKRKKIKEMLHEPHKQLQEKAETKLLGDQEVRSTNDFDDNV